MHITMPISQQLKLLGGWGHKASVSLSNKPHGKLIVQLGHKSPQYYYKESPSQAHGRYLGKRDLAFIQALAQKDYDERFLKAGRRMQQELADLESMHAERSAWFMYQALASVYTELSEPRQKLVHPYVLPDDQYIERWLQQSYRGLSFAPDDPVFLTEKGDRVRSKSEKMLADKLWMLEVPYLYERPLLLDDGSIVYVDFTLLDILERIEIYDEHFGMVERPEYCRNAMKKIERYGRSGLYSGDRFLYTLESEGHSLDMQHFERMIRDRFGLA